jgi:predicted O-methyltransferase YrrM
MAKLAVRAARRAVQRARSLTRRRLYPWIPGWAEIRPESAVHAHVPAEYADWFEAHNTGSTEYEVLNWLYATIRVLKPAAVLETGAADGLGTIALASACAANGFGVVHSVEIEPALCAQLRRRASGQRLSKFVNVQCRSSLDFLQSTDQHFDIGWFDSLCEIRAKEFKICLDRGIIGKLAVFHDTSPTRSESMHHAPTPELHAQYRKDVFALAKDPRCSGFMESTLSRGFIAVFVAPR